jgi:hypothetical protein
MKKGETMQQGRAMNDNRPKQILNSTFEHLEKVIEEKHRENHDRKRSLKTSETKGSEAKSK